MTPEGGDCTKPKTTPLNEGVIVDVTCTDKDGKQTISTTFTGDFTTRYHAILKTTFDPPLGAISHMGVNIDGKYLGPDCKAGEAQPETKWLILGSAAHKRRSASCVRGACARRRRQPPSPKAANLAAEEWAARAGRLPRRYSGARSPSSHAAKKANQSFGANWNGALRMNFRRSFAPYLIASGEK